MENDLKQTDKFKGRSPVKNISLIRLAPHFLFFFFFLISPLFAQWQTDARLTANDSASLMSMNNARCIAAGPNGVLHVVWFDERDGGSGAEQVYYKRSTDAGTTWSQDTRLSFSSARAWYPSVCVSGSHVHVVWFNETDQSIHYKRSTNEGVSWLQDTTINQGTTWTYAAGYPSITASGSTVHVVWSSGYQYLSCLYISYNRSTDNGVNWSGDLALTDSTVMYDRDETPSISVAGSDVHVIWKKWNNTNGANIYYKHSTDGGMTWSPDTCLLAPGLAMDPSHAVADSMVHVVWFDGHNGGQIYYKRSVDRGMTWLQEEPLSQSTGWVEYPSIVALGFNIFAVWEVGIGGQGIDLCYRHSTDGGMTWLPESLLTTDPTSWGGLFPSASIRDTMVHLVWQDGRNGNYEVYYKRNLNFNPYGMQEKTPCSIQRPLTEVKAVPNPFTTFATIPNHETERFALYDIAGQRFGVFRGDRIGEGLPPGVYFIKPESGKDGSTRLVKIRH
jgi:hypothetical protein